MTCLFQKRSVPCSCFTACAPGNMLELVLFYILVVIFSQIFCLLLMADVKNVFYMNLYTV